MSGVSSASSIHELLYSAGNAEKVAPISVAVIGLGLSPDVLGNEVETSAITETAIPTNRFAHPMRGTVMIVDATLSSREHPAWGRCTSYRVIKVVDRKTRHEAAKQEPNEWMLTNLQLPKTPGNQGCYESSQDGSLLGCSPIIGLSSKDDFSQEQRGLAIVVSNPDTKAVVVPEPIGGAVGRNTIGGGP